MKKTFLFYLVIFVLLTSGCSKWETIGTIDKEKIVTLDELWENSEMYKGKVITLMLDTVSGMSSGYSERIGEIKYYQAILHCNTFGIHTSSDYQNYFNAHNFSHQKDSTVFTGTYHVGIVFDRQESIAIPDWIDYKGDILKFNPLEDEVFQKLLNSPQKYVSGIFLDKYENTVEPKELTLILRDLVIIPIGYSFLKNGVIKLSN